jgi:hypothetical protein
MRIFFVGMHNKPGMKPLDSKTQSGKRIDKVIAGLAIECFKTNLCECEQEPPPDQMEGWGKLWHQKYNTYDEDIIVLLGEWVQKAFPKLTGAKIIHFNHPAALGTNTRSIEQYGEYGLSILNKYLTH